MSRASKRGGVAQAGSCWLGWIGVLLLPLLAAAAEPADCRYADPSRQGTVGQRSERVVFPDDDVFRPLLADARELRFFASVQRTRFLSSTMPLDQEQTLETGIVGLGTTYGLFGRRSGRCDGWQVGASGAVLAQFDIGNASQENRLLNTDFLVGFPVTVRRGVLSARIRPVHQSSHVGDELVRANPGLTIDDFRFEAFEAIVGLELGPARFYGGGGAVAAAHPNLDPGIAQWGVELRAPSAVSFGALAAAPVLGCDFRAWQEQEWAASKSAVAGAELFGPDAGHRVRVLFVYSRGFLPFGQFFARERLESFGVTLQFEL